MTDPLLHATNEGLRRIYAAMHRPPLCEVCSVAPGTHRTRIDGEHVRLCIDCLTDVTGPGGPNHVRRGEP